MVPPGVEAIVGLIHDPTFRPLLMVGHGGITTNLLCDRSFGFYATPKSPVEPIGSGTRGIFKHRRSPEILCCWPPTLLALREALSCLPNHERLTHLVVKELPLAVPTNPGQIDRDWQNEISHDE